MFPPFLNYAPAFYADRERDRCLSFAHSAESQCDGMSAGGEADAASRRGRGSTDRNLLRPPAARWSEAQALAFVGADFRRQP